MEPVTCGTSDDDPGDQPKNKSINRTSPCPHHHRHNNRYAAALLAAVFVLFFLAFAAPASAGASKLDWSNSALSRSEDEAVAHQMTVPRQAPMPAVSIEAVHAKAAPLIAHAEFRVTRSASSSSALTVNLSITQTDAYLSNASPTVTILENETSATVKLRSAYSGSTSGSITATVASGTGYEQAAAPDNAATVEFVAVSPPYTYWLARLNYTVNEGGSVGIAVKAVTVANAPKPREAIFFSVSTDEDTAEAFEDYIVLAVQPSFAPDDFSAEGSVFSATKTTTVQTVNDDEYEGDEQFGVTLERAAGTPIQPSCPCSATVTIKDDDTLGVSGVEVTSAPSSSQTYGKGETIEFTVSFNGGVTVAGTPQFGFTLGEAKKQAEYARGSDSKELVFAYTVVAGDNDADGVSWDANALALNGGSIRFMTDTPADAVNAALTHDSQAALPDHKVATPPLLVSAVVDGATLTLTYNKDLDTGSTPAASAFTAFLAGRPTGVTDVSVTGKTVALTLLAAAQQGQSVEISYAKPSDNPIQDTDGADAAEFSRHTVTNATGNTAPQFAEESVALEVEETVGGEVEASARNVGAPVTATDPDDHTLTYTLEGSEADAFDVDSETGQISTKAGRSYDREATESYSFTLKADDGDGGADTIAVTVNITNVSEPPQAPALPAVTAAGFTSIEVSWSAPDNTGRPAIVSYEVQYREGSSGEWSDGPQDVSVTNATITDLDPGVEYQVQVRAANVDGEGPFSEPGGGRTRGSPGDSVMRFGAPSFAAREGGPAATVTVTLNPARNASVTLELNAAGRNGATAADWSGAPPSITFAAGESEKSFTVSATADNVQEQGESVRISLGVPPDGVVIDDPSATVVTLLDAVMEAEDALRLVAGPSAGEGRLEVFHDNQWGTVCDDRMDNPQNIAPELACRLMGFTHGELIRKPSGAAAAPDSQPIWLDDVLCISGSTHWNGETPYALSHCHHAGWGLNNCRHDEDVWLRCSNSTNRRAVVSNQLRTASLEDLPSLSVDDAEVVEGPNASLAFTLTLDRAASESVAVSYRTVDVTARAGSDYEAASGTVVFPSGVTTRTVSIRVYDDSHDEGSETMRLELSPVSNEGVARLRIADGTAIGTITNTDPMPRAWLARFGREAASHVVDAIDERMKGGSGAQVTLGGQNLAMSGEAEREALESRLAEALLKEREDRLLRGEDDPAPEVRYMTMSEMLLGSSFHLASDENVDTGSRWSVWGRGARSSFSGKEDALSLEGDVTTATLGFDIERGKWLLGLSLSRSAGEGSYSMGGACETACSGDVESALTGLYPYASYRVSDQLSFWGIVGHGRGELKLTPEGKRAIETEVEMSMAAAGARGVLLPARKTGDFELALRTDLLVTRTSSDAAAGLAETEAETSRLRLLLEGSRSFKFGENAVLTPSVELGLRYDGGDAERGSGLELGASLRYAAGRLEVEVSARGLLAHSESDYEEWGVSGSVLYAPGEDGRGLSVRVGTAWGASGNAENLWTQRYGGFRAGVFDPETRLDAEVAYGVGVKRGLLTPYTGVAYSQSAETWRAGARWNLGPEYEVSVEASLTEHAGDEKPESGVLLRGSKRW